MIFKLPLYIRRIIFLSIVSLTSFLLSIYLISFNHSVFIEWIFLTINSCNVEFVLILDWISTIFLRFVTLISAIVLFYSGSYIENDNNIDRFLYLVLAFVFSIGVLICSPNLIRILLGWDGLGLVSYLLVIYYQNEKSANAGILTVLSNRIGDVAILIRIALIFNLGNWNFISYSLYIPDNNILLKALIILAAITKSAQMPFSAWLPAAIAAPTPVSALVHSSTLVTAGVYLLIRFRSAFLDSKVQPILLIISSTTIFIAGLGANFECDLKKIIALSTLRQLGVIIRILALGFPTLAFFHLLTHALFKALLFICAGVIIHNMKDYQDIRSIGRLASSIPLTCTLINLANLALCGRPFLAGFYSKDLILEIAFIRKINIIAFVLYVLATGLTASYTLRLIFTRITSIFKTRSLFSISDESTIITSPMLVLRLGATVIGRLISWLIFPEPYIICLPFIFKTLALIVTVLGIIIGYIINITRVNFTLKVLSFYPIVVFSGSIWFIPFISTYVSSYTNLNIAKSIQSSIDKGWSEFFGAQGLFDFTLKNRIYLQITQNNLIKLFMKRFLFWVIILFFIIIYSNNLIQNSTLKLYK